MGKRDINPKLALDKIVTAACGIPIKNRDIPKYVNEVFWSALERWYYTKLWGLANGNGWANEPVDYIEAITTIESEKNAIEIEEMEQRAEERKNQPPKKK